MKDVEDGLAHGQDDPITPAQEEAAYQAWRAGREALLAQHFARHLASCHTTSRCDTGHGLRTVTAEEVRPWR
jgi:hypothetical protein